MIELNQLLCEELDLTYWQLNKSDLHEQARPHNITREEKELLRKILLAKGITLSGDNTVEHGEGVVVVNINKHQLIFDDVTKQDTIQLTHLAKLSDMLLSVEQKKQTWYKLKNLDF